MTQVLPLLVVVVLIAGFTLWYRRANGVARRIDATFDRSERQALGLPPGRSLLMFTAPSCPPCTVARRVLDDVSARTGVPVVVADVTEHHAIAAAQHVFRAPTIFVVDERGHAVSRISGVPRTGELDEVLSQGDAVAA